MTISKKTRNGFGFKPGNKSENNIIFVISFSLGLFKKRERLIVCLVCGLCMFGTDERLNYF